MLYAILDAYDQPFTDAAPLAIVEADSSMGALDAFAEREGFAPYSSPEAADYVYVRVGSFDDGTTLGAIFTNSEIAVYPLTRYSHA
jgi:hypothetical protein